MYRYRSRFAIAVILAFGLTNSSEAHTLSLMVTKSQGIENSKTTVYMAWGHLLPVDELVSGDDISIYRVHEPAGAKKSLELDSRSLQAKEYVFEKPGVHQFEAVRKTGVFTMVKKSDGKTAFLRVPKSEVNLEPGSVILKSMRSHMFSKAIAVCGDAGEMTARALGHRLEIVPMTSPGHFRIDKPIRMQVQLEGKPLANASVKIACIRTHSDGSSTLEEKTDANGEFEMTPSESGLWTIHVIHSLKSTGEEAKQFDTESFVSSLTIGIEDEKP